MKKAYGYGSSQGTLFAAKEAYRTIRTNLMFSVAKTGCKTVVFTSSVPGEGKTTSAANVAFSVARSNKKVLLIDLDLRNPHVHRLLKLKGTPGLTNYLSGFNAFEEIVCREVYPNLDVIPAGTISPNPSEMVGSEGMAELLTKLREKYDFIILDTPPLNVVSDALSMLHSTDGVVLVVRPKYTARKEIQRAIASVEFVKGKILGVIVNGVDMEKKNYGRYGRYGRYSRYSYGQEAGEVRVGAEEPETAAASAPEESAASEEKETQ